MLCFFKTLFCFMLVHTLLHIMEEIFLTSRLVLFFAHSAQNSFKEQQSKINGLVNQKIVRDKPMKSNFECPLLQV